MTRTVMFAAFAALLTASPMALAAENSPSATEAAAPAAGAGAIQGRIEPNQVLAGKLEGAAVYNGANQKIGTVKDIVIGRTGQVVAVVLNSNKRNIALGMQDLRILKESDSNSLKRVVLNVSEAKLNKAPSVDLSAIGAGSGSSSDNGAGSGSTTAPAGSNR